MIGFINVGLGGALGAVLRYAISLIPYKQNFPLLTLITNVLGALLIGYITGIAVKKNISANFTLFLKTGVCGGFTTFSTFSLEAYSLLKQGNYTVAALYVVISVIGCLVGICIGTRLAV